MSEYRVEAYFLPREAICSVIGSKNEGLKAKTLRDESGIIEGSEGRFTKKGLRESVGELIDGLIDPELTFNNSFALWAVLDAKAEARPNDPSIGYPFIDLYDFCELLRENENFSYLTDLLETLNGQTDVYDLPLLLEERGELPGFAYVEVVADDLIAEARQLKADVEATIKGDWEDESWLDDFDDDPDDLIQFCNWIEEAQAGGHPLLLVLDGDL